MKEKFDGSKKTREKEERERKKGKIRKFGDRYRQKIILWSVRAGAAMI